MRSYKMKKVKSWMEDKLWKVLEESNQKFWYEPWSFYLRNRTNLTYTPDFLLDNFTIDGKLVILEPHGSFGDYEKFAIFRKIFGSRFYLILIVRNDAIPQIPQESYDYIWPIEYIGLLLNHLRNCIPASGKQLTVCSC